MEEEQKNYDKEFIKHFWSKVSISKNDECWNWQAAKQSKGYGCIGVYGKIKLAHRISYEISFGEIPEGMLVLHKCDNRLCVNPGHLFLGTHKENMRDMVSKGRQAKGEDNGNSKLKLEDINTMREVYRNENQSYRELAKKFGISYSYIGKIIKEDYWKLPLAE